MTSLEIIHNIDDNTHDNPYKIPNYLYKAIKFIAIPIVSTEMTKTTKSCDWTLIDKNGKLYLHWTVGRNFIGDTPGELQQKTLFGNPKESNRGLKYEIEIYDCAFIPKTLEWKFIAYLEAIPYHITTYMITAFPENCKLLQHTIIQLLTKYIHTPSNTFKKCSILNSCITQSNITHNISSLETQFNIYDTFIPYTSVFHSIGVHSIAEDNVCTIDIQITTDDEDKCSIDTKPDIDEENYSIEIESNVDDNECSIHTESDVNDNGCSIEIESDVNDDECSIESDVNDDVSEVSDEVSTSDTQSSIDGKLPILEVQSNADSKMSISDVKIYQVDVQWRK